MREHQLVQIDSRYRCYVCEWTWNYQPRDECPGVKRYAYGTIPDHLVTFTELRRRKLKPGEPPAGAYRRTRSPHDYLYFYDLNAARPRRDPTEKQKAAIDGMRAALVTRYTCERCHWYDHAHGRYQRRILPLRIRGEEKHYCTWCRDRQALVQALKELLESDIPLLILDAETTGLPSHMHFQVVEVAALDRHGSALFHSLIKPDIPMPERASVVNGITDEMLADAPLFGDIWPQLAHFLCSHEIYCYNAAFDREAVLGTAVRYHLEIQSRSRIANAGTA